MNTKEELRKRLEEEGFNLENFYKKYKRCYLYYQSTFLVFAKDQDCENYEHFFKWTLKNWKKATWVETPLIKKIREEIEKDDSLKKREEIINILVDYGLELRDYSPSIFSSSPVKKNSQLVLPEIVNDMLINKRLEFSVVLGEIGVYISEEMYYGSGRGEKLLYSHNDDWEYKYCSAKFIAEKIIKSIEVTWKDQDLRNVLWEVKNENNQD